MSKFNTFECCIYKQNNKKLNQTYLTKDSCEDKKHRLSNLEFDRAAHFLFFIILTAVLLPHRQQNHRPVLKGEGLSGVEVIEYALNIGSS